MIKRAIYLLMLLAGAATAQPYPPSTAIVGVSYCWGSGACGQLLNLAQGSDNWPITWADNGHQYTSWGDGGGFGSSGSGGSDRVSLGFGRVQGGATSYVGINVWGGKSHENPATFGGKAYGLLSVGTVMYSMVTPGSNQQGYDTTTVAFSNDHSATWVKSPWRWVKSQGVAFPTLLNFGQGYAGARDNYIYAYFIDPQDTGSLGIQTPGHIWLARVLKTEVLTEASWQWYTGTAGGMAGTPTWGVNTAKTPVFQDLTNGVGWCLSVSYNAGLQRYLLSTENTQSFAGRFGLFDAPNPWGPWTTVEYFHTTGWHTGHDATDAFYRGYANKWASPDGVNFMLVYSGNDEWNAVSGTFTPGNVGGGGSCNCP